jgi:hemerythrin superfamily protein
MSILDKLVAAVTPSSTTEGEVNAIDLLKKDHDDVDALFKEYDMLAEGDGDGDASDKRALSTRICGMLAVHAMIEEEIFYPAARKADVDADLLDEAEIEHGSAKELIAQIGAAEVSEPLYDARVKVLGEYIRHHVKEEENELFPACRKSEMHMAEIGSRLQKRKTQLLRKLNGK